MGCCSSVSQRHTGQLVPHAGRLLAISDLIHLQKQQLPALTSCKICRTHVPGGAWQSGKSITLDTDNGAIDLEPGSLQDYAVWVLGLNAALVGEHGRQVAQTVDLPASQMSWCRSMFTMSA